MQFRDWRIRAYKKTKLEDIENDLKIEKIKNEVLKNMYIGF